ncbi:MAG: hypothetical protein IPL69_20435 [Saprospiraceae bacterium]|nr:hypothetical protein [Candidatus Brachybacter algidus]
MDWIPFQPTVAEHALHFMVLTWVSSKLESPQHRSDSSIHARWQIPDLTTESLIITIPDFIILPTLTEFTGDTKGRLSQQDMDDND